MPRLSPMEHPIPNQQSLYLQPLSPPIPNRKNTLSLMAGMAYS